MENKIIIIGGRGTALNIAENIRDAIEKYSAPYELLGFANDFLSSDDLNGIPVVSKLEKLSEFFGFNDVFFIYALYKPDKMEERVALLKKLALPVGKQLNFVHPNAYVCKSVRMGIGNVIMSGVHIHNSVRLNSNNIINSNVIIEHDTKLGDSNFFAAGSILGSNVNVGTGCFAGLGALVRENVIIDDYAFIGMGSVVLSDIEKRSVYYGNPARKR